jgi:arsenate reductase-like glutaredoxin family protein
MKEIDLLKEAQKESSRIGRAMQEFRGHESTYKERLENLIKELPDLLANMALEEGITRAEIDEIEESIQYQVRNIVRQIEKLYQSTKDKLKDGDESPGLIEQLKACAPYIGMVEDAEEFLSNLKKVNAT